MIFSKIDLRTGYHQLRIREDNIPIDAMVTMSLQTPFVDLVNILFRPFLDLFIEAFIDHILVYSRCA